MIDWLISNAGTVGGSILTVVASFIAAFVIGRSKGKATAENNAKVDKVEAEKKAIQAIAERQTTVAKEATNVQSNVNRMSDTAVDDKLREKWRSPPE